MRISDWSSDVCSSDLFTQAASQGACLARMDDQEETMERIEHRACFGGWQDVYRHRSEVLGCDMTVGVYFPPPAQHGPCPVLYWLSGLTCNEQNFIPKAGPQRYAAEHGNDRKRAV